MTDHKIFIQRTIDLFPIPRGLTVVFVKFFNSTESRFPWLGFIGKNNKSYFVAKGFRYYLGLRLLSANDE